MHKAGARIPFTWNDVHQISAIAALHLNRIAVATCLECIRRLGRISATRGEAIMLTRITMAGLLAGATFAFASPALAQMISPERAAAIHRCIAQARSQYPDVQQDMERSDLYKACMTSAGQNP
jgi:hypothetical protein